MPEITSKAIGIASSSVFLKTTAHETFSSNYVIHAYEQGKQKGRQDKMLELESDARNQFSANRDYTIKTIDETVDCLISNGVIPTGGWVKSEGLDDFDVIIGVPQKDYLSDRFDRFYEYTNDIENKSNNPNYHLNIRFINSDKPINDNKLFCDGYKLKFEIKVTDKASS